jgi:hypothetical protein
VSPIANITFRSLGTGQQLACFERQTRGQIKRLIANPPAGFGFVAYEVIVSPCV